MAKDQLFFFPLTAAHVCPMISNHHEHDKKAGHLKDFCNPQNTWSCLKANLQLSVAVTSAHTHTHPALTCKMHGCPWDVMDGGGECTGVKKSLSIHPQGEKKNNEQIEDQSRERDVGKSRVKDEEETTTSVDN